MTYIVFNKNKLIKPSNSVTFQSVKHWPLKHIFVFIVLASSISVSLNLSYEYVLFKKLQGVFHNKNVPLGDFIYYICIYYI